jgi:hypothetical protein
MMIDGIRPAPGEYTQIFMEALGALQSRHLGWLDRPGAR